MESHQKIVFKLAFAIKENTNNNWKRFSSIQCITAATYLSDSNDWVLRNFYTNASAVSYVDCIMVIDLTATFGLGNEPDKEWCDNHIDYFEGTATIYK